MNTKLLIILTFLSFSCSAQRSSSGLPETFTQISFGSGGGFTGATSTYLLKANGKVYKSDKEGYLKLNRISGNEIQKLGELINKINFYNLQFSEKGNMTYFIEIKSRERTNKVTWTESTQAADVKDLYKELVNTLKR